MASYTIFEKPDPMKSNYTIKDIIRYTLIIDKNKNNIFINYETDATIPCPHIRCNPNNFIKETFSKHQFERALSSFLFYIYILTYYLFLVNIFL